MTIETDDSSPPTSSAPSFTPSSAPTFDVGLVAGTVTLSTPCAIAGRNTPVVINPHRIFYYRIAATAEDLTTSKLYMKGTIWIGEIPFSNTTEAWNYMLEIPNNKRQAKLAKDHEHQFVFLLGKMGNNYQTFANQIKSTWKSTGMARDTMASIVASLQPHIIAKSKNCMSTLEALEKHWGRAYYKQFYQIDKVIGSDKLF